MIRGRSVALIIPALDEEEALPPVLRRVDRAVADRVVVADNGSLDRTAEVARAAGAEVVREERRGYGSACLAALRAAAGADLYVFLDGDGSDDPAEIERVLRPILDAGADLVIGSRVLGGAERGALTLPQAFGNHLTSLLVRLFWRVPCTDLGPFRAVTREALDRMEMADPDYGWTIEMQVKAARLGLRIVEVPVSRRARQAGRSKVSGDLVASAKAGWRILTYVLAAKLRGVLQWKRRRSPPSKSETPVRRPRP
jgi:glycosyltransferase involved in cell wall biosynthesis